MVAALAALVVVGASVAVGVRYRRQIVSHLTHWKGSPSHTVAYEAYETAPRVHLAVAGDIGDSGSRLDSTGRAIAEIGSVTPYDVLLLLGDNVYPSGDPAKLPRTVYAPFGAVLEQGAELLAILGNHDVKATDGAAQLAALGMPGRWWARELDGLLVVGLDSNTPDDADQLAFLERTLTATDAKWKIVALHHPPFSAGYQGSDVHVRDVFAPLFAKHGVQLVLSGHDHDYQRSERIDGVTYVVTGGAAGTRRTGEAPFTAASFGWHHFVDVAVFEDRMVVRAVDKDERVADEAVLLP